MIQRLTLPFGGINLHADPTAMQDGQWQIMQNFAPVIPGVAGTRPALSFARELVPFWWHWDGRAYNGSLGVAGGLGQYWRWAEKLRPVRFLFDPNFGQISAVFITTDDTTIYRADSPTVVVHETVPAGTMLLVTLPGFMTSVGSEPVLRAAVLGEASLMPSLFVFNGVTYAFAGQNAGRKVIQQGDPSIPVQFSYEQMDFGNNNGGFQPDGAFVLRNRIVYFKGSYVWFSAPDDPEFISVDDSSYEAMSIFVGGEELDPIVAGTEVSTTAAGSPAQSAGMVFTRNNAYMLLGEPLPPGTVGENGDVYGSLQVTKLNVNAGCVSQATIKRTPYGTFWVGPDDVWFMPHGSLPVRVGTNIRPLLEQQPKQLRWKIHAEYANDMYRVSLFAPGQGPNLYSPCGIQVWLDLSKGPPQGADDARWYGQQVFANVDNPDSVAGVYCMARDERPDGDNRLYALQPFKFSGDGSSIDIYGMSLCNFEGTTGHDLTAPASEYTEWTKDTEYFEGDRITVWVQHPSTGISIPAVFVCSAAGWTGESQPDFATGLDSSGSLAEFVVGKTGVTWTALFFDGTYALAGFMPESAQTGSEVYFELLSKELFLGDQMVEKLIDGAELGYWCPTISQVYYNSHPDQAYGSRVLTPSLVQNVTNTLGLWNGSRQWQTKLLTADPTTRFRAYSAMFEIRQGQTFLVTEDSNDYVDVELAGVIYKFTIPAGNYASLAAALAALEPPTGTDFGSGDLALTLVDYRVYAFNGSGTQYFIYPDSPLMRQAGFTGTDAILLNAGTGIYSDTSPYLKPAPVMLVSGLNLRFRNFGRRPQ